MALHCRTGKISKVASTAFPTTFNCMSRWNFASVHLPLLVYCLRQYREMLSLVVLIDRFYRKADPDVRNHADDPNLH